uniref:Uncharacterized protein n=1 Tax=Ciona savignyi TaxID=51511 RepID=H2Z7V0_CIOSA
MFKCSQHMKNLTGPCFSNTISITRNQNVLAQEKVIDNAMKSLAEIPKPKSLPILGTFLDYTKFEGFEVGNIAEFYKSRFEHLGPIFKENILPGLTDMTVYCSSPQDNETMFRTEGKLANRDPIAVLKFSREKLGIPTGLVNIQGEEWYTLRKIVNKHFLSNSSVWSYDKELHEVSDDFVEYISQNLDSNNEVPNFRLALNKWALEGAGTFCLDTRFGMFSEKTDENLQLIVDNTALLFDLLTELNFAPPVWRYFETKKIKALKKCQAVQLEAISKQRDRMMEKVKHKNDKDLTKLEILVTKKDLPDSEVAILISDMLGGGVDTTSNAAAFMLYVLAINPEKQEILREEIKNALQSDKVDGMSLQRMKYLHACVLEAQRMFPLTVGTTRRLLQDTILSGYLVPKGTKVIMLSNVMNGQNPAYFEDPETYLPERWLQRNPNIKFAMTGSFGIGARACPGRKFAMQEVHYLLISVLSRFKLQYNYKPIKA